MATSSQFISPNFNGANPASPWTCPHCLTENPVGGSMCEGRQRGKPCCWIIPIIYQARGGTSDGNGNDDDGTSDAGSGKS